MIVVTGASGFIGCNLVGELNRRGYADVLAVDEYPWLHRETRNPDGIRYGDQLQVSGFLDKCQLAGWLDREGIAVTAVIHLGACSDTTVTDRDWIMANNLEYTQSLWDWCTRARRPFLYASSAATYGDGSLGYDDSRDPGCYRPLNLYGESKHQFDLWAGRRSQAPPRWVGFKYFNVYGPHEEHKGRMASVACHGFHQIIESGVMRLFQSHRDGIPDGGQQRDFVHVSDAVRATLHFLDTPVSATAANGLYNVGVGEARTFADLAIAVFRAMGRVPRIVYVPMPDDLRDRYQYKTQAKIQKLRQAGFAQSMVSLEEGVLRYVRDHLLREAWAA